MISRVVRTQESGQTIRIHFPVRGVTRTKGNLEGEKAILKPEDS